MLNIKGINLFAFTVSVTASKRKLCEPVSPAGELARHPMSIASPNFSARKSSVSIAI